MSLLGSLQPEKQSVDAAINVVCDRLEHATLLQDRRAAVLSLKGFAREYKEAVTAGGLRGLLRSLTIDQNDEEILKATLDCLLTLFTIDDKGSVDDTTLWIADEFTLRPENTHVLLDIVTDSNYYIRLHALQILGCIQECRLSQLQECVMSSPSGIGSIVGILDEAREQLRNEGLLLLSKMVSGHMEIQKRVAFENAFDKVFAIITEEGGLYGGIVTADCFSLLHNLLSANISNQNWFRETEFFKRLRDLLQELDKDQALSVTATKNVTSLLEIVRLFVPPESTGNATNQNALMRSGIVTQVVGFACHSRVPQDVRAQAWLTLADLIHNNGVLQDYFAKASAIAIDPMASTTKDPDDISSLQALLLDSDDGAFQMKHAVSQCLQSFVYGNQQRKLKILQRMIDAYLQSTESNLLDSMLASGSHDEQSRVWFATCTVLHMTHDDEDAIRMLTDLKIGDATVGEEEVTIIQTISGSLITAIQRNLNRSVAAYLMLLSSWLFGSPQNVADFLEDQSTLQALLGVLQADASDIIKGLCATLLNICYAYNFAEFTSINRRALQTNLLRVGRELIVGSIVTFGNLESLRQPHLYYYDKPVLDTIFIDFFRDNYGQIRKSLDQAPIPPRTRKEEEEQEEQARNDDMISELEVELERKSKGLEESINIIKTRQEELQRLRDEVAYMNRKHESETAQAEKSLEKYALDISLLKAEAERSSRDLEMAQRENAVLAQDHDEARKELLESSQQIASLKANVESLEEKLDSTNSRSVLLNNEVVTLRETSATTGTRLQQLAAELEQEKAQHAELSRASASDKLLMTDMKEELSTAKMRLKKAEGDATSARTKAHDLETDAKGLQQQIEAGKRELDKLQKTFEEEKSELQRAISTTGKQDTSLVRSQTELEKNFDDRLKEREALFLSEKALTTKSIKKLEADLQDEKEANMKLQKQLVVSKEIAKKALGGGAKTNGKDVSGDTELLKEIEQLKKEKGDLQKQLEQAQEDLMLLIEDEAADAEVEAESNSGDVD